MSESRRPEADAVPLQGPGGGAAASSASAGERPAVSYLVRFWLEPSADGGEPRGCARDLLTGEERYYGDPGKLAEEILRRLHSTRRGRLEDDQRFVG